LKWFYPGIIVLGNRNADIPAKRLLLKICATSKKEWGEEERKRAP